MDIALIISSILGVVTSLLSALSQIFWWQKKEYRWDRMYSMIMSPEGSVLRAPFLFVSFATLALGWIFFIAGNEVGSIYSGWVALLAAGTHHIERIRRQGVLRPDKTLKAAITFVLTLAISVAVFEYAFNTALLPALQWATFLFFLPVFVMGGVFIANGISNYRKRETTRSALKLRESIPDLTVIGITGSVGKTSTKHFLYQLLTAANKNVFATKEHRNSEFTVAQDMLEQLTPLTQTKGKDAIYIAEMGAYRHREIADIARIAKPRIGILTSISTQHASLFGGVEEIAKVKWELIKSLKKDGVAVLNKDSEAIVSLSKRHDGKKIWYSAAESADVFASNVVCEPRHTEATLSIRGKEYEVEIPLASEAMVSSVLGAVAACHALGISDEKIIRAIGALTTLPRTMEIRSGIQGSVVIDDSYSASELSVKNALLHLKKFPEKKKRVVLVPLIELGDEADRVHQEIGELLAESAGAVFVFGNAYRGALAKGVKMGKGSPSIRWYDDPKRMLADTTKGVDNETVTLLEGRIPSSIRELLIFGA